MLHFCMHRGIETYRGAVKHTGGRDREKTRGKGKTHKGERGKCSNAKGGTIYRRTDTKLRWCLRRLS